MGTPFRTVVTVAYSNEDDERCRVDGCTGEPRWRWWNGMGAFAGYCNDHAREQLKDSSEFYGKPITRPEDVSDGYVLPAGIQPLGSSFPTIRTKEAFDMYLESEGERPRLCRTSYCNNLLNDCETHAKTASETGTKP